MLERIQNAPRATRQKWFVICTVVAGIILLFLWVQYLSWTLRPADPQTSANEVDEGFNPLRSLKGIGASIYDAVEASRPANRRNQ